MADYSSDWTIPLDLMYLRPTWITSATFTSLDHIRLPFIALLTIAVALLGLF